MTFKAVDALLERELAGDALPAAAERLDLRLLCFGRGVAVYEMPSSAVLSAGVLGALAEAAATAAAMTTVADGHTRTPALRELCVRVHRDADGAAPAAVRAEAVVTRFEPEGSVAVEGEVHCAGERILTFKAGYEPSERVPVAAVA